MSGPDIGELEIESVLRVLRSSRLSQGPFLAEFERLFAAYLGCRCAVAVSSGTAALHLGLRAAGVGPGDLVFTTPFSFVATANAVLYQGARPVFVDVEASTGNMDADSLSAAVRSHRREAGASRSKAILPVHVFGQPADMTKICGIASEHGLAIVEDACEALGAEHRGRKAGTFGGAAAFGFYPNKQVTCGEGGMLATDREDWAERVRRGRNHGREDSLTEMRHVGLGFNYRLDEMSAAMGAAQISRVEELLASREKVAGWYQEGLSEVGSIELPASGPGTTRMSWFVYVVRFSPSLDRDRIRERLWLDGVPSRVYFPPIHLQPLYRRTFGYRSGDFPKAEELGRVCLALPFSGAMSSGQVEQVVASLKTAIGGRA